MLVNSLWDRLAHESELVVPNSSMVVGAIKRSVARDLEHLLNTRQAHDDKLLMGFHNVQRSVFNYGVADFAARSLSSGVDQHFICHSIADAIQRFDERLFDVNVSLKPLSGEKNKLCFDIRAVIRVGSIADAIDFDVVFDTAGMQYRFID